MVFVTRLSRFVVRADSEHREEGVAAAGKGNEGPRAARRRERRRRPHHCGGSAPVTRERTLKSPGGRSVRAYWPGNR